MTGVQTCALPISAQPREYDGVDARRARDPLFLHHHRQDADFRMTGLPVIGRMSPNAKTASLRSEERRVGKECVSRVDLGGRRIIKKKTKINVIMRICTT